MGGGTRIGKIVLVVGMHLAVLLVWHLWVVVGEIEPYIMPTPFATFETLLGDYDCGYNTLLTGTSVFGVFWLAVLVGVSPALVF